MAATYRFSEFPVLKTSRLILRDMTTEDAADVLAFRGDAGVQKYNSVPLTSLDEALEFINAERRNFIEHKGITWAIADAATNQVIGSCCFGPWNEWHQWSEIGYDLRKDRWGQGLASEALRRMIEFGFEKMGMHRIEARTRSDNAESLRLLQRFGFKQEGLLRERVLEDDGLFYHGTVHGLLKGELIRQTQG